MRRSSPHHLGGIRVVLQEAFGDIASSSAPRVVDAEIAWSAAQPGLRSRCPAARRAGGVDVCVALETDRPRRSGCSSAGRPAPAGSVSKPRRRSARDHVVDGTSVAWALPRSAALAAASRRAGAAGGRVRGVVAARIGCWRPAPCWITFGQFADRGNALDRRFVVAAAHAGKS